MKRGQQAATTTRRTGPWFAADRKRLALSFALALLLLVSIAIGIYVAGRGVEGNAGGEGALRGDLTGRFKEPRTIVYGDKAYHYRSDLTTVLFLGVDRAGAENLAPGSFVGFRNGGPADFLLLMVIDPKKEEIAMIQIDRDTMAEITILGVLGNPAGTNTMQICLSHGFGDGGEQSALFAVEAVSKHLLGVDIDFFVTMSLKGVPTLNDMLGGVTVTLEDDFTALDPAMQVGETLTLRGKQAEYFVRNRLEIGAGTNASRMVRQKQYMAKAGELIDEKLRENVNFVGSLFDALSADLTTNMSRGRMINEAYASRAYRRLETISPRGEHRLGEDGFMEFHADPRALEELVLGIFFEPAS